MYRFSTRAYNLLFCIIFVFVIAGCQSQKEVETISNISPTVTTMPTITPTFTPTHTTTPAFTITSPPTNTPSNTVTPFRVLSATPTSTQIPPQPAVLFPFQDTYSRTIDWSYGVVTSQDHNVFDEINDLWAFLAFKLLDRGIHQFNYSFLGKTITVYYLNVAHAFDGTLLPMQLILGGTEGENIPINVIPAGGTAYIQVSIRNASKPFNPQLTHLEANRAFDTRDSAYPFLFIEDLQMLLPSLPDELILLANHPILVPRDNWHQVELDMQRVSYLAARYHPFFEIDPYYRLVGQSPFAKDLSEHLLHDTEFPWGDYAFSSRTLVIITNNN